ncbi:MAG: DNA primase [Clostridia bacterium]|nr:DNA primase [Clostridia bacterium]
MIERAVIEEVLARTDLPSLIGSYVTLKRAGTNLTGLCPFHSEKTPSFTVFTGSNSFYCFGCGAGGDAITFVRRMENLEYPDAIEVLAKRAGITVRHTVETAGGKKYDRRRFYDMNREAARFFHANLHKDTPNARAAMDYLREKRGLSAATITHFGLGYAPAEYGVFSDHMKSEGYTEQELIDGFLCGRSEKGRLYDAFRNRVMFPIIDLTGNIIAFGGRVMDDSLPKYKNSSDTPVFKKSRNLFALNFARTACAEQLILCEGYMDVIALHAAGFTNAVATLGTALTEEQARMISRYTKKVIISYDMDEAGRRAADRAVRMFSDVGVEVKLLKLQDAKDPDEYIKKFGADKFRRNLEESRTRFDYNFERILGAYDLNVPQEKVKALAGLCELISGFYSSAERDVYIATVAKKTEINPASIRRDVERLLAKQRKEYKTKENQKIRQSTAGLGDKINPDFVRNPSAARAEETVLGLMLMREELCSKATAPPYSLVQDDFFTAFGKKVFAFLTDGSENRQTDVNAVFSPEEVGRITQMRIRRMQLTENGENVFADSITILREAVAGQREKDAGITLKSLTDIINRRKDEQ